MVKAWMIILILSTHTRMITADEGYEYHDFIDGSIFKTQDECMGAVKQEAQENKRAFCVETYIKGWAN